MKSAESIIEASKWLSRLPADLAHIIVSKAARRSLKRGSTLFNLGDPPGPIFGVETGVVAIQTDDSETEIVIGHLFGPGAWFGENSVLLGLPRQVGAVVKSHDATVLSISPSSIEAIASETPAIWRALAGLGAMNANVAVETARNLMIRSPIERVSAVLDRITNSLSQEAIVPITQEELAVMCALSRGSISRVLGVLE